MRLASDEREHRRGLVLGLTMAEVLLLLLFLLLLALAARLVSQAKAIQAFKPIIETLNGGEEVPPQVVEALARDVAHAAELRRHNDSLRAALADATKRLDTFKRLEARAREINPDDPPAALRSGLNLLAKRGDEQARLDQLDQIEEAARAVEPDAPPFATIESALSSMSAAHQAGADAKMGGQIRERVAVLRETERQVNERLEAAFGNKLKDWGAELDPASMTLRFRRPDLLFGQGSAELRPAFKAILNDLFPQYIRILYGFKQDLEEVRIEGHTSSEWAGQNNDLQAYFLNMALSQERTRAVLEYGLTETQLSPPLVAWAREHITANGLSSSRPRERDGIEDKEASRRVEFRVLTRAKEQLLKIVEPGTP